MDNTQTFLGGTAVALFVLVVTLAGWKHRVFLAILFIVSVLFAALALAWPTIREDRPRLAAPVDAAAATGLLWFGILVLCLLLAGHAQWRMRQLRKGLAVVPQPQPQSQPQQQSQPSIPDELLRVIRRAIMPGGGIDKPTLRSEIGRYTDPNAEFNEEWERLSALEAARADAVKPLTVPPPKFRDSDEQLAKEFDFPWKRALLQASIPQERGQCSAREGKVYQCGVALRIESKHNKPLQDCSVFLDRLVENGIAIAVGKRLRVSKEGTFLAHPGSPNQFTLLSRDISDPITPAPFLIPMVKRDLPLKENSQYVAEFELRSRYPYPTRLVIQIDTGSDLDVRAVILKQELGEKRDDQ